MRAWMIPWLMPLAILVIVLAFALAPGWVAAIVFAVVVLLALVGLGSYLNGDDRLPGWMSGWRR